LEIGWWCVTYVAPTTIALRKDGTEIVVEINKWCQPPSCPSLSLTVPVMVDKTVERPRTPYTILALLNSNNLNSRIDKGVVSYKSLAGDPLLAAFAKSLHQHFSLFPCPISKRLSCFLSCSSNDLDIDFVDGMMAVITQRNYILITKCFISRSKLLIALCSML
jgi:hypothetical protein